MAQSEAVDRAAGRPSLTAAGMIIWLGSEAMFFGGLFAAYFTLKANTEPWPGEGVHLDTTLGVIFTLVLVASSFTIHQAARMSARHDIAGLVRWLVITLVLAALFIGNQAYEWSHLDFTISSHPFGSLFYLMTGFHGLHVLGGMAAMALMVAFVRRAGKVDHGAVESISYYWHFVDVVWILLFITVFFVQ
ncbi:MAG TPA: heme-copper oxidase subunit III [Actinomycetota bacterium]|nr:heme-copper oxidase subunit III [Actinomycetota bacterium]